MKSDQYGRQILTENDICELYLQDPDRVFTTISVESKINFPDDLELINIPQLVIPEQLTCTVEQYDLMNQNKWYMPVDYENLDIAKYLLDLCKTETELQRVGHELLKYQEYDLFPMLRYCKYLVDTMRKHKVVWGVGRGSSVASYVLYLLGIHKIDSIYYDLSIDEFFK